MLIPFLHVISILYLGILNDEFSTDNREFLTDIEGQDFYHFLYTFYIANKEEHNQQEADRGFLAKLLQNQADESKINLQFYVQQMSEYFKDYCFVKSKKTNI